MNWISKIKNFFLGESGPIDDFEKALIEHLLNSLNDENQKILSDQIDRFNKIFRDDEIAEKKKVSTYFYWKEKGKNRRDFPLKFKTKKEEEKLATIIVDASGKTIEVDFNLVDGVLFSMEFFSKDEMFRPLNPFFNILSVNLSPSFRP